jgi:ribosome-associated protein
VDPSDKTRKKPAPRRSKAEKLLLEVALAAHAKKARNLVALDVRKLIDYTDYFLIGSGRNDRQLKAICGGLLDRLGELGLTALSVEGQEHGRWVAVDLGVIIVHLFLDELRDLYELDKLWCDAPRIPLDLPALDPEDDEEEGEALFSPRE